MSAVLKIQDATASVSLRGEVEWSGVRIRAISPALARGAIARGAKVRMGGTCCLRMCEHTVCYESARRGGSNRAEQEWQFRQSTTSIYPSCTCNDSESNMENNRIGVQDIKCRIMQKQVHLIEVLQLVD
jgi:hypothetical protein